MEGDVKRLEELMERLPTSVVCDSFVRVKRQRMTRVLERVSKRLKRDTSDLSIIDDENTGMVFSFNLLNDFKINIYGDCSAIGLNARIANIPYFRLAYDDLNMNGLNEFPEHVKKKFLTVTGLRQDVPYTPDTFITTLEMSVIGRTVLDFVRRLHDVATVPLYYIRQEAYTVLAIHKFRRDSVIARLPKDVLRVILELLWP